MNPLHTKRTLSPQFICTLSCSVDCLMSQVWLCLCLCSFLCSCLHVFVMWNLISNKINRQKSISTMHIPIGFFFLPCKHILKCFPHAYYFHSYFISLHQSDPSTSSYLSIFTIASATHVNKIVSCPSTFNTME